MAQASRFVRKVNRLLKAIESCQTKLDIAVEALEDIRTDSVHEIEPNEGKCFRDCGDFTNTCIEQRAKEALSKIRAKQ